MKRVTVVKFLLDELDRLPDDQSRRRDYLKAKVIDVRDSFNMSIISNSEAIRVYDQVAIQIGIDL